MVERDNKAEREKPAEAKPGQCNPHPRRGVGSQGETGSGKEVVARALHDLSARRHGPFVAINAGALAESVVETQG